MDQSITARQMVHCAAVELGNDMQSFSDDVPSQRAAMLATLRQHEEQLSRVSRVVASLDSNAHASESAGSASATRMAALHTSLRGSLMKSVPLSTVDKQHWNFAEQVHSANDAAHRNAAEQGDFALKVAVSQTKAALIRELEDIKRLGFAVVAKECGIVTIAIEKCTWLSFRWVTSSSGGKWQLIKFTSDLKAKMGGEMTEVAWFDQGVVTELREAASGRGLAFTCCLARGVLCGTVLNVIAKQAQIFAASYSPHFTVEELLGTERSSFVVVHCDTVPLQLKFVLDEQVSSVSCVKSVGTRVSAGEPVLELMFSPDGDGMCIDTASLLWRYFGDAIKELA